MTDASVLQLQIRDGEAIYEKLQKFLSGSEDLTNQLFTERSDELKFHALDLVKSVA